MVSKATNAVPLTCSSTVLSKRVLTKVEKTKQGVDTDVTNTDTKRAG
jgi:hypothetical protein